jgi:hypothetical protein
MAHSSPGLSRGFQTVQTAGLKNWPIRRTPSLLINTICHIRKKYLIGLSIGIQILVKLEPLLENARFPKAEVMNSLIKEGEK